MCHLYRSLVSMSNVRPHTNTPGADLDCYPVRNAINASSQKRPPEVQNTSSFPYAALPLFLNVVPGQVA